MSSSQGFCVHCVTSTRIPGEPRGKMENIHGINTYVATPKTPGPDHGTKAIIYFYDAFGLKLDNNKIIPDNLADATGLNVYVPDVFNGGGISESAIENAPSTAEETRSASLFAKSKMAKLKPWIETLKADNGYTRLGGVGYCYGGKLTILLNATGHIDVSVANHPSMITKADVEAIKNPILFNCAEEDPIFSQDYAKQVEKDWSQKSDKPAHKFNFYPNTVHGFAARPNLANKQVKDAFEGAFNEGVAFWKAHL